MDKYLLHSVDTNYITLPEHSWRLAQVTSMTGIYSSISSETGVPEVPKIKLLNHTTPSVDLGFHVAYRSLGVGYSWDLLHAYSRKLNLSFGSRYIGLDFSYQNSTNISSTLVLGGAGKVPLKGDFIHIRNCNLSVWYALNSRHYSHHAATKQAFIQRKTAGSLLLNLSYMSSYVGLRDTLRTEIDGREGSPFVPALMADMTSIQTRQIAIGLGYGINYTPNKGKVVLHLSANALLVCYSVNRIGFFTPDSVVAYLPGEPVYNLKSSYPVHVTGSARGAISWEISKWVHLNAYATVEHIRFRSARTETYKSFALSNLNWQARVTIGVRLGAGKDRVQRAIAKFEKKDEIPELAPKNDSKKSKIPQWITDYFWSPLN